MRGTFVEIWDHLGSDLWNPLTDFSGSNGAAPLDLFSDLFDNADPCLSPRPTLKVLESTRNDPGEAEAQFRALRGTDFASEGDVVLFLEDVAATIDQYEIPGFADHYRQLLQGVVQKYNLRYRLAEPFAIRFLLSGSFANLYEQLERTNGSSPHLVSLLNDFEHAFNQYSRSQAEPDLRQCIANASKYAEGLAGTTCGETGSLGELCNKIDDWPHVTVREALKKLYGFSSNYPNIRHAGNADSALRGLDARDATLMSLLFLTFAGYLSPQLDAIAILGV